MREYTQQREQEWEAIDQREEGLDAYYAVYQAGEEALGYDGVFFD